jgi:hypothetical protein
MVIMHNTAGKYAIAVNARAWPVVAWESTTAVRQVAPLSIGTDRGVPVTCQSPRRRAFPAPSRNHGFS